MAASNVGSTRPVLENILTKETIRLKDNKVVVRQAANTKYQGNLRQQGDTVTVQQVPNIMGVVSTTAGATVATSNPNIASHQLVVDKVFNNGTTILDIDEVQSNLNLASQWSNRFAYASANHEDQYVASFASDANANNKVGDQSPITLSAANTYSTITNMKQLLSENNAFESSMLFITPAVHRFLKLENILDSTDTGLGMRLNGEVGRVDGFRVMETNNVPHIYTLTLDTQVTATDTMSINGYERNATTGDSQARTVVFTYVAAGAAANAGEIALGATLAATQQNTLDAINGTGTASASTYIELAAADRAALRNANIKAGTAFSAADGLTITGFSGMNNAAAFTVAETFTAVTNVFSAAASLMFAVDNQAINFVSQMDRFKVKDLTDAFSANMLQEKVYGGAVLGENAKGIATAEVIA